MVLLHLYNANIKTLIELFIYSFSFSLHSLRTTSREKKSVKNSRKSRKEKSQKSQRKVTKSDDSSQ